MNKLNSPGLDHGLHRIHQVVHQRVNPVLLVVRNRAHGLLAHSTLIGVTGTLVMVRVGNQTSAYT